MAGQRFLRAISNRARTIRAAFCTEKTERLSITQSSAALSDMTALSDYIEAMDTHAMLPSTYF